MKTDTMVTYKQLHQALTELGFVRTSREGFIVYRDAVRDAVIILPAGGPLDRVPYRHLLTAGATVVYKGVTDQQSFEHALSAKNGTGKAKQAGKANRLQPHGYALRLGGRRKLNEAARSIHIETRQRILQNLKKVASDNAATPKSPAPSPTLP